MDVPSLLRKAIKDMDAALDNDLVMQHIVANLAEKIRNAKLVKKEYRHIIDRYYKTHRGKEIPLETIKMTELKTSQPKDLLFLTVIYFLSNLNQYDYMLINLVFEIGLRTDNVIVLLLLNNINDIEAFCSKNKILGENCYAITTLKKLSALHKVIHNF